MPAIWNFMLLLLVSQISILYAKDGAEISLEEKFEVMVHQQKIMENKIRELENKCNVGNTQRKRFLMGNVEEQSTKIAFDAIISHNMDHSGISDTTIIFDQVLTNIGNAYQKDIGVFIAPVKGVYLFTFTIHADYAASLFGSLTVDGRKWSTIHVDSSAQSSFVASSSRTVIVSLNQSDRAYIQVWKGSRGLMKSDNLGHTAFAGTLLFPMN